MTGTEVDVTEGDKRILRSLGERLAAAVELRVQAEKASMWRALNCLRRVKPMVWIEQLQAIFSGILDVEKRGANGFNFWFAPWDEMIRWWGVQEALIDLHDRPEFVHKAMDKLVNAYCSMLDQFEEQNLLTLNNTYYRTGGGAWRTSRNYRCRITIPHTSAQGTCGVFPRLRSFLKFHSPCTGSSPYSTNCAG